MEEDAVVDVDPVWTSSRTARQIHALSAVEKDISRLLTLASSSMSLLTLPQTDKPGDDLPQGDERSEQFVLVVSEYFEKLDGIQDAIRSSLAHIRQSRIAPSTINAPPPGFIPPALGVGLPQTATGSSGAEDASRPESHAKTRGLQEERVERDAWRGVLDALERIKLARDPAQDGKSDDGMLE
ncbi:hypothetical protein PENSPDRAFT_675980 [Peniophora sp. CONT]|nr:hypothetical protein PENSPDRAFT_675980 [Peniophora sp. CONT]